MSRGGDGNGGGAAGADPQERLATAAEVLKEAKKQVGALERIIVSTAKSVDEAENPEEVAETGVEYTIAVTRDRLESTETEVTESVWRAVLTALEGQENWKGR